MTTMVQPFVGAPLAQCQTWSSIDWKTVEWQVRRLQMRIAKAIREGRHNKAKALQWLLTHSHYARLLAVRRVVQNKGAKTPGVDGVVWETPRQKLEAALKLKRRGYSPKPLRRIYIPKKNGKQRPLSIPVMSDRAQQALHLLGLEPISETLADKNSYGFRPKRAVVDAIEQCHIVLARRSMSRWVLEGDIKACFDKIDHDWLVDHTPMDREILRKWLKSGYIENNAFYRTEEGTPQGGIISPTIMNMALDGLERSLRQAVSKHHKVNYIRYADDFIVTGVSETVLEKRVKPVIKAFLSERGLELSPEKTKITHVQSGLNFLGFTIRKFGETLIIKPSKDNVKRHVAKVRSIIKSKPTVKTERLIGQLTPIIRGWANFYRHANAAKVFSYVDHCRFGTLWRWVKRRHPNKSAQWRMRRYFRSSHGSKWTFFAKYRNKKGKLIFLDLFRAGRVRIERYVKIRAAATPYDPEYVEYFVRREHSRKVRKTKSINSK